MKETSQERVFAVPKPSSAWHLERTLKPSNQQHMDRCMMIQPAAQDVAKVLKAYAHHPITGFNIGSIEIAYSKSLNRQFFDNIQVMNKRKNNPRYTPSWPNTGSEDEKTCRKNIYKKFIELSANQHDLNCPNIHLLPMWHGTSDEAAWHILETGYGIFSNSTFVTDDGFFGKGIYTTHEAEYAFRAYAKKHNNHAILLLNWVSILEVYPVIEGDMPALKGKMGGYDQCDAHFIPVRSEEHPDTDVYLPCGFHQAPNYHELVVFNYQQCLPRYQVKLVKHTPEFLIDNHAECLYQNGLDALKMGQFEAITAIWENAAEAGHPGAWIRLHWWYTGSDVSHSVNPSVNPKTLAKLKAVDQSDLQALKHKASFRGENNAEAQFTLGWAYQHGLGCEVDQVKAAKYYWLAANQTHRDAQYQLAQCCASGIGVNPALDQAITYYEQAAEQGHLGAHEILANLYTFGLGVVKDLERAEQHKQAMQKGHASLKRLPETPFSPSPTCLPEHNLDTKLALENKRLTKQLMQQALKLREAESQMEILVQKLSQSNESIFPKPKLVNTIKSGLYTPMLFQPVPMPTSKIVIQSLSCAEKVEQCSETTKITGRISQHTVQILLDWAAKGCLTEIRKMLKQNSDLTLCTGTLTDLAGRQFKGVTVFQYAAWCLDRAMCVLIVEQMNEVAPIVQLHALYSEPHRYSRYGDHYDMLPLFSKTKELLEHYEAWRNKIGFSLDQYWVKNIGREQRMVPAWIIHAWCEEGTQVAWTSQFKEKSTFYRHAHHLEFFLKKNEQNKCMIGENHAIVRGERSKPVAHDHFHIRMFGFGMSRCNRLKDVGTYEELIRLGDKLLSKLKLLSQKRGCTECTAFSQSSVEFKQ